MVYSCNIAASIQVIDSVIYFPACLGTETWTFSGSFILNSLGTETSTFSGSTVGSASHSELLSSSSGFDCWTFSGSFILCSSKLETWTSSGSRVELLSDRELLHNCRRGPMWTFSVDSVSSGLECAGSTHGLLKGKRRESSGIVSGTNPVA